MGEGRETVILAGCMLLLVWYVSLPCDGMLVGALHAYARSSRGSLGPQALPDRNPGVSVLFNASYIVQEIAQTAVYFVIPSVIICKMFLAVRNGLCLGAGY